MRAMLRWAHRWLGLTLGLVFANVALTGSLLFFQPQFFEWAHGQLIPDELTPDPGSVDAWVRNAKAAVPNLGDPIAIWRPHVEHNVSDAGMLVFAGLDPGGLGNMGFAGVLVAPATGTVLGVIDIDRSPAYAPLFFHRDFWAGESGRIVSGIMAVGTLISLSIGLYLWWPPRNRIFRKLSPAPWRATLTSALRLHNRTGVWMLGALLVLLVSGLHLVQPTWVAPVLAFLPGPAETMNDNPACDGPMGFDAALESARKIVPHGTWTAIYPHDDHPDLWEIRLHSGNATDVDTDDIGVVANLACGSVSMHDTAETRSPRHTAELWLSGLHDGTVFGLPGELFVTLLGIVPLVLLWTGVRMWLRGRGR